MYELVRVFFSFVLEMMMLRTITRVVEMRSDGTYYALGTLRFAVCTAIRIMHPHFVASLINFLAYTLLAILPVVCSDMPVWTSLSRATIVTLAAVATDAFGSALWILITGYSFRPDTIDAGNVGTVVLVYCMIILIAAILFESVIAFYAEYVFKD